MKMKTIQRAFAWALTLVMVLSAAPLGVFAEGEEGQTCICTVKCGETAKEDCPVCGGESGNPEACVGKTQEELEAAAKLAAEEAERKAAEEAAQKAAEEEKRKAEEEAAQKAAKEGGDPSAKVELKKSEGTTNENIAPVSDDDGENLNDTPETVEVSFVTNGAEETIKPMMVAKGDALGERLPSPRKSGYTFVGWYKDQNFTEENKVTNGTKFEDNTILYAKWTENKSETGVDVIFNFQLENVENVTKKTNAEGKLEGELPSYTKTGFDLKGWYLTTEYKEDQKVTSGTEFKQETTVYAKWEQQPEAVTVTFKAEGGACDVESTKVNENKKLESLPKPEREGYTFLGWYIENTETKVTLETIYENSTTLVARWEKAIPVVPTEGVTPSVDFLKGITLVEGTDKVEIRVKQADETTFNLIKIELDDVLDVNKLLAVYDLSVHMLKDNESLGELKSVNGLIRFDFTVTENVAAVYHGTTPMSVSDGTTPGYLQNGSTLCIWANSFSPYAIVTDGYRITLNTQGGTLATDVPNPMVTDPNGKLQVDLPMPTKTGYTFGGWYRTADCAGNPVKKGDIFDSNATLYAKWTAKPGYTVTFDFNGVESSVNSYTTDNFGKLGNLPKPERDGCSFLGWYIGETKVDVNHIYTENTTLVAKWSRNVNSIEVKSDSNGISAPDGFLNGIEIDPEVAKIEVVAKSQENEALKEALKGQIENFDKKHVLQFDLSVETWDEHGNSLRPIPQVNGLIRFSFGNIPGNGIRVFRLHGGNLQKLDESDGTTEGYSYSKSDGTLTIFANQFSPYAIISNTVAVKIDFDPMGGTVAPKTMTTGTDGKLKDPLPTPTRTGYTFDGWYSDKNHTGNKMTQDVTFLRDSTLYAKWIPNTYTVTFHDNYNDPEVKSQQTFTYDVAQSLDCGSTIRRDYYTLSGWAETSGGPKKFAPTETVQSLIPEGNKDLYALWTYEPRRVTFDADGGKIKKDGAEVDKVTVNTQEAPINTVKAADVPVPELREGYYFGGWYTQKNGKGDLVKTGETKEPTVFTRDATVYAYWIKFEPVTVTFKCQGGTARIGSTDVKEFTMQTKWPGVLDGTPSTPGRSGYKFEGWYTAAGVKVDADTLFLRNSTVYAHWKRAVSITGNPRTGDQVKLEAAIGILAAAAIGLGATVVLKKRKEK